LFSTDVSSREQSFVLELKLLPMNFYPPNPQFVAIT